MGKPRPEIAVAEGLASVDEVAKFCGVPTATIHQWLYKGTGPRSYKVGRYRRFRWADVHAWLERQADDPRSAG